MGIEGYHGSEQDPSIVDGSRLVDDVGKAQAMAEAANEDRTIIAEEKKVNNGKEFSIWGNHENAAQAAEDIAGVEYEMQEKAKHMTNKELMHERAKIATLLEVLQKEEKERGLR